MSTLGKAIHDCLLKLGSTSSLTDGELLGRFVAQREEAAFQELVQRHGPMVLRVCQRMLRHAQDAEDAFQATFIVLARKAGSVAKQELVGGWLHGVACRVAMKSRTNRRRAREQQLGERVAEGNQPQQFRSESMDLRSVVDEEVNRLPEKYRSAMVLHYLEGKTCEEAARLLGCQTSALKMRLERARERLRGPLERRGLALSAGTLATLLAQETASAALPGPLLAATVQAAAGPANATTASSAVLALADAAMKAAPRRLALGVLAVVLLGLGMGGYLLGSKKPTPLPDRPLNATGGWHLWGMLDGHFGPINAAAFSPDGTLLATASSDKTAQLWDVAKQVPRHTLRGHEKAVGAVAFSPDGRVLATTGWDRTVRLWEVATGRPGNSVPYPEAYAFTLAFTPDGKLDRYSSGSNGTFLDQSSGRTVRNPDEVAL